MLAHGVGLPLHAGRAEALARAVESDLRLIALLRAISAGELHPAGSTPLTTSGLAPLDPAGATRLDPAGSAQRHPEGADGGR